MIIEDISKYRVTNKMAKHKITIDGIEYSSQKYVKCKCDECNKEFNLILERVFDKHLCVSCNRKGERNQFFGHKHSDEFKLMMREKNPSFRSDVKACISEKKKEWYKTTDKQIIVNIHKKQSITQLKNYSDSDFVEKMNVVKQSDSTKKKISAALIGRIFSDEQKNNMSISRQRGIEEGRIIPQNNRYTHALYRVVGNIFDDKNLFDAKFNSEKLDKVFGIIQ